MSELQEGQQAPDFIAKDESGAEYQLSKMKGKNVILYFYPKDDTPGCTAESCNLRDNYSGLKTRGIEVVGVSADDEKSHKKFIAKYALPFRLISDIEKKIITAYGVWGEKTVFGKTYDGILRTTFVINEKGFVEKIFSKVETGNHTKQILEGLGIN